MPATACSPPTTPRSRRTSRPRSMRPARSARPPIGPPAARGGTVVVVLDFGSQFAQLIARRVRELNVYSELLPHDTPMAEIERRGASAIILSGGPNSRLRRRRAQARSGRSGAAASRSSASATAPSSWPASSAATCSHRQARVRAGDGHDRRGGRPVRRPRPDAAGLDEPRRLDHGHPGGLPRHRPDRFERRSPGLTDPSRNLYGIQFHPEVAHTPHGRDVLRNFVVGIAGVSPNWTPAHFIDVDRRGDPPPRRRPRARGRARTARSSARSPAASTRPSRRRSSTAPWAIG